VPEGFDVAGRLAQGAAAVERAETYVWACRQVGYQHPDLTAHPGQLRDWYGHDDGLDLRALDADCAALSAAASAADDVLGRQAGLTAQMAGAWSGLGAGAAREFLWRHERSAVAVRDGLRRAADAMAALRDELWRAVDTKVDAVLDVDDRRSAQRAEWLAAAQVVNTGAGDRATASELVDQQIKPFVDNDIRSDWLGAIHAATAAVTAAYDAAVARLDAGAFTIFEVPGELGPPSSAPDEPPSPAATAPAAAESISPPAVPRAPFAAVADTIPAPVAAPAVDTAAAAPAAAPFAGPLPAAAAPAMPSPSPMPSLGELGGGMPALGTGVSGIGQQLADMIGGLLGSSDAASADAPGVDPTGQVDEPADPSAEKDKTAEEKAAEDKAAQDEKIEPVDAADESVPDDDPASDQSEPDAGSEPAPTPVPPPLPEPEAPIPPAVPDALPKEQTPCEIAADELPQVGE
jgi:hypothetical protein